MTDHNLSLATTDALQTEIAQAIREARSTLRWKPGKNIEHLQKRIRFGQLPSDTRLETYEALIRGLLHDPDAGIYVYYYANVPYPVVIADWQDRLWAVIMTMDGVLETAFLLLKPEQYIKRRKLIYLGLMQEVNP